MKNTILSAIAALFLTATVNAQSTVDSIAAKYKLLPMPDALTIEKSFPVLGTYQLNSPAQNAGTAQTTTSTTASTSMGSTSTGSAASTGNLTVTLDSASKGIVWVEGLPQGRVKAYLRKSPATYRILSQKTASGKQIQEGTLMLDTATKTLNIALGAPFNEADPASIFGFSNVADADNTVKIKSKTSTSKTKSKVTFYTATKVQQDPMMMNQQINQQGTQNSQQSGQQSGQSSQIGQQSSQQQGGTSQQKQ